MIMIELARGISKADQEDSVKTESEQPSPAY
jgi:hypothetical protein